MEKRKPHFWLKDVKELIEANQCTLTVKARQTAHSIGFSDTDVTEVVATLESKDFFKSMTSNYNPNVWQDVYKKKIKGLRLYIKLQITQVDDQSVLILSFKRDESGGRSHEA